MFQKFLKENNIRFFTTHNETKASKERFNRTLKRKMWKYFTVKNTVKYIDIIQRLVKSYKHSRHRGTGMKPADVSKCDEVFVWQKLYEEEPHKSIYYKFNIGDQVRISKARRTFKKGYLPNWTEEVFTITKRVPRRPPVYKIADHDSDEVEGVFYEEELQNVTKTQDDFYRVIIFISVYHVSYLEQSASFVRSFFDHFQLSHQLLLSWLCWCTKF
jgi:hypothetical protein